MISIRSRIDRAILLFIMRPLAYLATRKRSPMWVRFLALRLSVAHTKSMCNRIGKDIQPKFKA